MGLIDLAGSAEQANASSLGPKVGPFHTLVMTVYRRAKVDPRGAPIHILRHTYATWMRRYAGADERDLLDTGAWRDRGSVARYTHTQVSEAARLADKSPIRASDVRNGAI
ncbi:MAG TPA: hypothetical protein VND97_01010 [Beijerinckiaceae bacterium]|nr:hypothetical protein [Beijerinckiaceae bacterium]